MPYDRAIWAKLRDPWFFVGTYIAANPDILIRGSFFTFFLISILRDREEFQVPPRHNAQPLTPTPKPPQPPQPPS